MAAKINTQQLKQLIEAAIFVADHPLTRDKLQETVLLGLSVSKKAVDEALESLRLDYLSRGVQLVKVASGYRFQSNDSLSPWLGRLWQEHAPRYSRAMLETLALIAYRQPVTRGEIEDVRGVAVSSNIVKTMIERDWVKVVGHKEVPGRPALYATTPGFLNYFGLKSLSELPSIEEFESIVVDKDNHEGGGQLKVGSEASVTVEPTINVDTKENQIH
jgi:segregation and condensation protein B